MRHQASDIIPYTYIEDATWFADSKAIGPQVGSSSRYKCEFVMSSKKIVPFPKDIAFVTNRRL